MAKEICLKLMADAPWFYKQADGIEHAVAAQEVVIFENGIEDVQIRSDTADGYLGMTLCDHDFPRITGMSN